MSYFPNTVTKFDPSNMSAFGTLEASELTPVFQGDWTYGINTQLWNTPVVSGTGAVVDTNLARLRIQSGTSSTSYAYITSRKIIRYRAGQGITIRFTPVFTAWVANSTQLWGAGSIVNNTPYDGYFFGYNSTATSMGITHFNGAVANFTAQANWNVDPCNGSSGSSFNWNPALGTPAMIKYPYLGYGDIQFFLQNPNDGRWILVHVIKYANTSANVEVTIPSLQYIGYVANSGNTTNLTMYSGSVGAFLSGPRQFTSNPRWGTDVIKIVPAGGINVLTIRNCSSYNGFVNKGMIRINNISVATTVTNQTGTIRFYLGTIIPGGSPSFTTINGTTADNGVTITAGNSIASFDTAGTFANGNNYIYNLSYCGSGSTTSDLINDEIYIAPGEFLTIYGVGSGSITTNVSLNWSEDI